MPLRSDGLPCLRRRMNTRDGRPGVVVLVQSGARSSTWAIADHLMPAANYTALGSNTPGKRRELPRRLV
jgi:hypothetical protein